MVIEQCTGPFSPWVHLMVNLNSRSPPLVKHLSHCQISGDIAQPGVNVDFRKIRAKSDKRLPGKGSSSFQYWQMIEMKKGVNRNQIMFLNARIFLASSVPKDGNWTNWSQWSSCSVSCSEGEQSRVRYCNRPAPVYGGKNCTGSGAESRPCFLQNCTGRYTESN